MLVGHKDRNARWWERGIGEDTCRYARLAGARLDFPANCGPALCAKAKVDVGARVTGSRVGPRCSFDVDILAGEVSVHAVGAASSLLTQEHT